jgi:hypothetical protein
MNQDELDAMADVLAGTMKRALDHRCRPLEERALALEAEVARLKARPLQKWAGTYVVGMPYAEASLVTRQGSLWVATTATTTTPGEPGSDWRLIVKRGDAR